jgi:hypothetical protein
MQEIRNAYKILVRKPERKRIIQADVDVVTEAILKSCK